MRQESNDLMQRTHHSRTTAQLRLFVFLCVPLRPLREACLLNDGARTKRKKCLTQRSQRNAKEDKRHLTGLADKIATGGAVCR